ncbi:adenine nucleotide alpha hydrolase [Oleiagrimonas sp. C23AA]|uniref:adenine nucleotide alpha hydrolase n=1 Tax=Oleiagrimonas sp. C23AA TaxID=2719047 RepID=UPI00141DDBF0|nr:adenine nucleotide alpha hydrolase [Oleiagrimonas sp. C23AA]NII11640.1 adenine nucleotide alpha hydrolase [Oleiagrimonas sp. C23AA]
MSPSIPTLLSWSGGKDCLMALARLRADPRFELVGLLSTVTARFDRVAMHGIRRDVLKAQAEALGLPLVTAELDWPSANDAYEAAIADALVRARTRWSALAHIAFGDLFLEDVRAYREQQLTRLGWQGVFPIWGEDTANLARRFVEEGHRAALVCVDTQQLAATFCGREFDHTLLDTLPEGVDACGENGEFHTLSWGGPLFSHDIAVQRGTSVLRDERFQYTDFLLTDGAAG